ncbi:mediator of RNA polymerase II transcription complex subunit 8-domain-containing protein [Limtongia smithiae]|uniref:mediator of RNA polymerase II transcription complex subunit 8-domain-containing protein n=1 Tax=Limtongia smithiae TaxID=1125753 RepID=UPI0034CEB6F7
MSQQASGVDPALDLSSVPVEALEQLRLRLSLLKHSLNRIQAQVQQPGLPPWPTIQWQFVTALKQLDILSGTLDQYADVFRTTNAYPLSTFPVAMRTGLLTTLLRKRVDPEVEEWIKSGAEEGNAQLSAVPNKYRRASDEDWKAAMEIIEQERDGKVWNEYLTDELSASSMDKTIEGNNGGSPAGSAGDNAHNSKEVEASLEQVLRYMYQGIDVHEPVRKLQLGPQARGPLARK